MSERRKVKYCQWQKGTLYFAVKGQGGKTSYTPLPDPDSPLFADAYNPLKEAHERRKEQRRQKASEAESRSSFITNSWKALIYEFERSAGYRTMKASTRENVDRYHRIIEEELGDRLVADYEPGDLDRRLDSPDMADYPGRAINFVKAMKALVDFGIRRGYRKDKYNPAKGAPIPKPGEHAPWPDDVFERALDHAALMLKAAILLGVYTGQRISDCIRIEREPLLEAYRSGEPMRLVQYKERSKGDRFVEVFIPIHPDLAAFVEALPASPDTPTVLYNRMGQAFPKPDQIQDRLKKLMTDLGYVRSVRKGDETKLETLYKFHGLRKLSSCHLVEAGATPHEVSAINGMDIQTVIHYTRGVAKKKLASGFSDRMNGIKPGQERPDQRLAA